MQVFINIGRFQIGCTLRRRWGHYGMSWGRKGFNRYYGELPPLLKSEIENIEQGRSAIVSSCIKRK